MPPMPNPMSALSDLVLPAATARFVLLANHVLTGAPAATERLRVHNGRLLSVAVDGWSLPLPPPPPLMLRITPAGLLEQADAGSGLPAPDLRLGLDATRPLDAARQVIGGQIPPVRIEGDAALAADISWVMAHVRWDIAADLERVFGPMLADGLSRAGEGLAATLRAMGLGKRP